MLHCILEREILFIIIYIYTTRNGSVFKKAHGNVKITKEVGWPAPVQDVFMDL